MKIQSEGKELLVVVWLGCFVFSLVSQEHNEIANGGDFPVVKIDPPVLDWGKTVVYSASTKHLSVENTCNDGVVTVHVAFSSSSQFVPCNHTELSLRPGEALSLCFVFAPTLRGVSSGQLVLQTSAGGFVVDVIGLAVDSPYSLKSDDGRVSVEGSRDRVSGLNSNGFRQSDTLNSFVDNVNQNPILLSSWEMKFSNSCLADDSFLHLERNGVVTWDARNLEGQTETVLLVGVLLALFLGGSFAYSLRRHDNQMETLMNDVSSWGSNAPRDRKTAGMKAVEELSDSHLTIRVLKEKLRRRRKRRSRGAMLMAADVSSSQSGNSTPTSPMSTVGSPLTMHGFESPLTIHAFESPLTMHGFESPLTMHAIESKEERNDSLEHEIAGNPKIPTSRLPPHARAPGLELGRRKSVAFGVDDKYRFDMWGDIFPAIDLMGISGDVGPMNSITVPSDFSGYFVKGPHTLTRKSHQSYVSCLRSEG